MTPEPILIPCEGSGYPAVQGICSMCGRPVRQTPHSFAASGGLVPDHDRPNIIAMIDREDFG